MNALDEAGRRLLAYLVSKLPTAVPTNPRTFVSYKDVHDDLSLPMLGPYGASLKVQGLVSLAEWTSATGKPGITGLIIDREKLEPGEGYFAVYGVPATERYRWWADQIVRAKAFDWTPYLQSGPLEASEIAPTVHQQSLANLDGANVWRLVAHHQSPDEAIEQMTKRQVLAVGWSGIGDLARVAPADATRIAQLIAIAHPNASNAQLGGPSLWNLYAEMRPGDLVILTSSSRRKCVFEVIGDYFFAKDDGVIGYRHQRQAALTNINADALWDAVGADVAGGQNIRWTLARCTSDTRSTPVLYKEGERYEVRSTAIERCPAARQACLDHHGVACAVCTFDFEQEYGELGAGYIHVHHRSDLSLSDGIREVDPVRDLVPLCPNCHAMVHRARPAMDIDELKRRRASLRSLAE